MAAPTYAPLYTNSAGTVVGLAWDAGSAKPRFTSTIGSDERQNVVTTNQILYGMNNLLATIAGQEAPLSTGALSNGTTVTLATALQTIYVNGVYASVAAQTGQAFGALGTIPEATWGLIKVQRVAAGTTTFVSAAANYTTGYASEADAIAAMPATTADRVAIGFITILAGAGGWVAGTSGMTGQTGGTPATATNFYNFIGVCDVTTGPWAAALQIANTEGNVVTTTVG